MWVVITIKYYTTNKGSKMKYLTNRWMEKVRFRVYNRPESKQQFPVVPSQFTDYTEL